MMKKQIGILMIVLLCGIFAFAPTTVMSKKLKVNVASTFPPDSPQDKGLIKFKQLAEQRSNGNIEVLIHASSAMGDERSTFEMLSSGSVEYGAVGTNDISTFFPKYFICEVPYVFASQDDFWKFWNGPGKELSDIIEKKRSVRTEGVIYRGARYLTANRKISSVDDVKGLKMRLPSVKSWFKVWESFGALPSSIAFSEVYMALKTGVVEAQENPPETILTYKFYEAQKYLIRTEHVYSAGRILSSASWWNSLEKADQDILSKAMQEGIAYANSITKDGDAQFVKILEEKGMILVPVDKKAFKQKAQPIIDQMAKESWDPSFYEKVKNALK